MATYKLIQDIEAEDHILGPLSLRQFIFALVAVFCYYLCFLIVVKHVAFLLVLFLPPALFCTFFAFPFGGDQPTEIWALAKLRFLIKPRRRIWNQSGVKELVTITVPKKVEHVYTNGLSQTEVQSRLTALANTLDSRGWAIKNVNLNSYAPPNLTTSVSSDRLIDIGSIPAEVPSTEVLASDDILDESSNPIAQQFQTMIARSSQEHRKHLVDELNTIRANQPAGQDGATADYWFASKGGHAAPSFQQSAQPVSGIPAPAAAPNDDALSAQLKAQSGSQQASYSHLRTLRPLGSQPSVPPPANNAAQGPATTVTTPADPAILSLATNNDLNVSTLAREAYKAKHGEEPPQDEVVISLR